MGAARRVGLAVVLVALVLAGADNPPFTLDMSPLVSREFWSHDGLMLDVRLRCEPVDERLISVVIA